MDTNRWTPTLPALTHSPAPPAAGATFDSEGDDDPRFRPVDGQIVVVAARWILVVAGLLLALWQPPSAGELKLQVGVLLILTVVNFALHAQILMRRPVSVLVASGTSAADLILVTLLILTQGGYGSSLFVFYFPAFLAFSAAFPPRTTALFAGGAIASYGVIGLLTLPAGSPDAAPELVMRLLMLAATAVCGSVYWLVERDRRREAAAALWSPASPTGAADAEPGAGDDAPPATGTARPAVTTAPIRWPEVG